MIYRRPIIGVIEPRMAPRLTKLGGQRCFIQFNPQARFGGQIDKAIADHKGFAQIALAQMDLLLGQEVGDGSVEL